VSKSYHLHDIVVTQRIERGFVLRCLHRHWVTPCNPSEMLFDEEDLARLLLIRDLVERFEVNDEGISVILHLLDQLYFTRNQLEKLAG
jgi:chaperone modulatory protein CbpM